MFSHRKCPTIGLKRKKMHLRVDVLFKYRLIMAFEKDRARYVKGLETTTKAALHEIFACIYNEVKVAACSPE